MNSMTGYGRGEATIAGMRCVVECASVNRKGLEIACQLPRELAAREAGVRETVAARVARGRVNISISVEAKEEAAIVEIDSALARSLLGKIKKLQGDLGLPGEVDINTLLAIPGILHTPEHASSEFWPAVETALGHALDGLIAMRKKEGRNLQRDLAKRIKHLHKLHRKMQRQARGVSERYREVLRSRLAAADVHLALDDARLVTEIAVVAERCDVSEELTRLESHYGQFEQKLESKEPIGRALEFLTQEIYRELNTLGSKAGDSELTQLVVDSKVELDRIREQILNVE